MGFMRIETVKGRAVVRELRVPESIRTREEDRAAAILRTKEENRAPQFGELKPARKLDQPVQDQKEADPNEPVFPDDPPVSSKEKK